jgi:hypothetical protein
MKLKSSVTVCIYFSETVPIPSFFFGVHAGVLFSEQLKWSRQRVPRKLINKMELFYGNRLGPDMFPGGKFKIRIR